MRQLARIVAAITAMLAVTSVAFAESDSCVRVFQGNVRDVSFVNSNYEANNSLYDALCRSDGTVNERYFNTKFGMTDFLDGHTENVDNSKTLSQFCENYKETRYSKEALTENRSTVVTSALSLFNQCEETLSKSQVLFEPTWTEDAITVHISFPKNIKFFLDSVIGSPSLKCRTIDPADPSKQMTLDGSMGRTTFQDDVNVVCRRTPQTLADGSLQYPAASLIIASSASSAYKLEMTQDTVYSSQLASETSTRIEDLRNKIKQADEKAGQLQASLNQALTTLNGLQVKAKAAYSGKTDYQRGQEFGQHATADAIRDAMCSGARASDIVRYGNDHDHDYYSVACLYDPPKQ